MGHGSEHQPYLLTAVQPQACFESPYDGDQKVKCTKVHNKMLAHYVNALKGS